MSKIGSLFNKASQTMLDGAADALDKAEDKARALKSEVGDLKSRISAFSKAAPRLTLDKLKEAKAKVSTHAPFAAPKMSDGTRIESASAYLRRGRRLAADQVQARRQGGPRRGCVSADW